MWIVIIVSKIILLYIFEDFIPLVVLEGLEEGIHIQKYKSYGRLKTKPTEYIHSWLIGWKSNRYEIF